MLYAVLASLLALAVTLALAFAGRAKGSSGTTADAALAIYKDQLQELAREREQGLIAAPEADAQTTEISRRMLQAAREVQQPPGGPHAMPWALALLVPVLSFAIYWQVGAPTRADVPRAARLAAAQSNNDLVAQVAMVEEHLERTPNDATGWRVLMLEYQRTGRFADAARALTNIMRVEGETGAGYAELAELLTFANRGLMSAEAAAAARAGLAKEPNHPKAMFYAGLALKQEGKTNEARGLFSSLVASAAPDAPWLSAVKDELAQLPAAAPSSAAPELALEQMEEGMGLAPQERQTMIAAMVDGLEQRLAENADDLQGWLRLIRARAVLGERDKAAASLAAARLQYAADAAALKALSDLAKEAGLP